MTFVDFNIEALQDASSHGSSAFADALDILKQSIVRESQPMCVTETSRLRSTMNHSYNLLNKLPSDVGGTSRAYSKARRAELLRSKSQSEYSIIEQKMRDCQCISGSVGGAAVLRNLEQLHGTLLNTARIKMPAPFGKNPFKAQLKESESRSQFQHKGSLMGFGTSVFRHPRDDQLVFTDSYLRTRAMAPDRVFNK